MEKHKNGPIIADQNHAEAHHMGQISKAQLAKEIAMDTGLSVKDSVLMLTSMFDRVTSHLKQGNKVQLTGFGTFEVRERSARTGVKPGTSEKIDIPASNYAAFKPGAKLKEGIRAN